MMENDSFWPYWAMTRRLIVILAVICFGLLVSGLLFSSYLDVYRLFGFPLGVLFTAQFFVLITIGILFWFAGFQDQIDAHHGADEDL